MADAYAPSPARCSGVFLSRSRALLSWAPGSGEWATTPCVTTLNKLLYCNYCIIVSKPGTLLIALPTELVLVVNRKEFMICLKAKALIHAIKCVQSMPNGVFRVTCKTKDAYSWLCSNGIAICRFQCTIMEAEPSYTLVHLFRCPFEVSDEAIVLALSPFRKVMQIKHETDHDFPSCWLGLASSAWG